jgi:hypothetical protein
VQSRKALHAVFLRGYYLPTNPWLHKDPLIATLAVDGETIETTPEHPFYTADGEWVPAVNLRVGDEVYRADGSYGLVEAISFAYRPQGMYNLTVEGAHTYFVGGGQWLVHNACPSKILGDNLVKSGVARPPNTAAHHVVPVKDPRAAVARTILRREGIGIDSAPNGVFLPMNRGVPNPTGATVHSTVNTNRYHEEILNRLSSVAPGKVVNALAQIIRELLNGTFPHQRENDASLPYPK